MTYVSEWRKHIMTLELFYLFLASIACLWFVFLVVDALLTPFGNGIPDKARKEMIKKRKKKNDNR